MNDKLKYDVCVFGGCSIDMMFYENEKGKFSKKPDKIIPGGKGANQAVAASRAGARVTIITKVGRDDIGRKIIDNLSYNGVSINNIEQVDGISNDYTHVFISASDKDNVMTRFTGAIDSFDEDMVNRYASVILNSKIVLSQFKCPKNVSEKLINFCYENEVPIIVTPCRPQKLIMTEDNNEELINKITYITCNEEECKIVFNKYKTPEEAVCAYPNKLIVTLGWKGLVYHNGEKVVYVKAIPLDNIEDTTGAGDTFAGNLAYHLTNGYNLYDSIEHSQYASALKIQVKTAQDGMPYKEELNNFIINSNVPNYSLYGEFDTAYRLVTESYNVIAKKTIITPLEKKDKTFVTESDLLVEEYILQRLKEKYPTDTLVTEESNSTNNVLGRTWILDPIDGTLDYMKKGFDWSTQLAFFSGSKTAFSIINFPLKRQIFYSLDGKGSFLNDKKLKLNKPNTLNSCIVEFCGSLNKYYDEKKVIIDYLMKDKKVADIKYNNICSLAFANLATGKTDALILSTKKPWDIMPGILLVKELGIFGINISDNLVLYTNNDELAKYIIGYK